MDIFCLAGSAQQAQQSTHLAEGLSPLMQFCNFSAATKFAVSFYMCSLRLQFADFVSQFTTKLLSIRPELFFPSLFQIFPETN